MQNVPPLYNSRLTLSERRGLNVHGASLSVFAARRRWGRRVPLKQGYSIEESSTVLIHTITAKRPFLLVITAWLGLQQSWWVISYNELNQRRYTGNGQHLPFWQYPCMLWRRPSSTVVRSQGKSIAMGSWTRCKQLIYIKSIDNSLILAVLKFDETLLWIMEKAATVHDVYQAGFCNQTSKFDVARSSHVNRLGYYHSKLLLNHE